MKIDWETVSQWRHYWVGWADFAQVLIQKCVAMGTLTARFYSNLVQRYNLVFLTKLQIFVRIDWEMTSQWRHYCFGGTRSFRSAPLRKCCHGNSKGSTLKLLPFNKFLYIFRKSQQIWLNYLSPSLSQKISSVVPNTPGRIGLSQWQNICKSKNVFDHCRLCFSVEAMVLLMQNFSWKLSKLLGSITRWYLFNTWFCISYFIVLWIRLLTTISQIVCIHHLW